MKNDIINNQNLENINATDLLKSLKENENVGLTPNELLHFLTYFGFIIKKENDKIIKAGYEPKEVYIKNNIMNYEVYDICNHGDIVKKSYTIKFTKQGIDYLKPLIINLIKIKSIVKSIKKHG